MSQLNNFSAEDEKRIDEYFDEDKKNEECFDDFVAEESTEDLTEEYDADQLFDFFYNDILGLMRERSNYYIQGRYGKIKFFGKTDCITVTFTFLEENETIENENNELINVAYYKAIGSVTYPNGQELKVRTHVFLQSLEEMLNVFHSDAGVSCLFN